MTITIDDELMEELDQLISQRGYQNRSEAIRDLVRAGIRQIANEPPSQLPCVAALVYVYNYETRELSKRLAHTAHDHHSMSVSTLHVHLDHDTCMEVNILKGKAGEVRHFADHIISERGIRHGQLFVLPVTAEIAKSKPVRAAK